MRILNFIIEMLFCPFTIFARLNINPSTNKTVKSILIAVVSLIAVGLLILFAYRSYIFK